jgi:hypothetical protein
MREKLFLYMQSACELALLLFASLADIELEIRVVVGLVGIALSVLTFVKLIGEIKRNSIDNKIKLEMLKREQEATRRYFEKNYEAIRLPQADTAESA